MQTAKVPTTLSVYEREPLGFRGSIPIFSASDEYIANYEQISADHISGMTDDNENPWIFEELWAAMEASTIDLVRKYSRPGDSILDVGVGLGRLLSHFPSLERYGMDISFGYLEKARARGIEACYARIEEMPYKREMFDLVTATDVLEHVADLNLACEKILSVLKPGGVMIVRVPYKEDLSQYLAPDYPYKFAHLRNFDEQSIRLFFERILNCECIEWVPTIPYLQNESRFRYRLPKGEIRLLVWLQRIEKSYPKLYQKLANKLVLPIEINVVVKKR